ncbi:YbjN domain-containing protein [Corynebacterium aquatimens]|uniref:YbjN domain-containing protein n=1 Tax=Corynebacterium TaxID=1716 RepID=UPI001F471856|nr:MULTISPECIES: YbjN domain-containing protein [Corynebacterium]QYH19831.1 YbjN domain-containing protein [Corynebacterium aquatimens]UIZ93031.1 YbjN domain-containing protein [Corynebacterium sp. CNCTC7651]
MAEQTLAPLTFDRIPALFDEMGWKYDITEEGSVLRTGFSGIGMELKQHGNTISIVTTVAVDTVTAGKFPEVLGWVERYNAANAFPTATAIIDPDRDLTAFGAVFSLPGDWGYSHDQFVAHITSGIEGVVNASRDFLTEFAPEVIQQIDAS